jgi:hypothetical protein
MLAQVIQDLYSELISVLADGNVTPTQGTADQLRTALRNIVDLRTASVAEKTVEFIAATTGQALTSGDTLATLFSKLAYWRTEYTNNLNNHIATDATSSVKGHLSVNVTGGLTITGGALNLQAASGSANGYMSSTDKTRLDNVYQGVINVTKAVDNQTVNMSYANGKTATSFSITEATASLRGLMSSTDKSRLDTIFQIGIRPRTATIVVGFTEDCDVVVPAIAAQNVINTAITGLTNGGKVIFREGTYNLSGRINVALNNITLEGMGNSTIFNAQFNNTSTNWGTVISATLIICAGRLFDQVRTVKSKCCYSGATILTFSVVYGILYVRRNTMNCSGFDIYEKSVHRAQTGEYEIALVKDGDTDFLLIEGKNPGFMGERLADGKTKAPLCHENAEVLRKQFPFTAPRRVLREERSFGLGDRLGIATPGHIKLFEHYDVYPVFAQQSIRELNLTGRTYEEVLDAAAFAVFREDFQKGWGADGDHLKTAQDVEYALRLGFTMITLDCSEHIKNNVTEANAAPAPEKYRSKYLGKQFEVGQGIVLTFSEAELKITAAIYGEAVDFAADMYNRFLKDGSPDGVPNNVYSADFEISIDETATPTTPLQHFFVAQELIDAGVSFATIAPRFCGEFQKGIDYIGDIGQFEKEITIHAAIARHFKYKLSIHSGSDKFSVFPLIGRECQGTFHVKTAGTNWLEAMRVIAQVDPALYREAHQYALSVFDEARKYYHVTADLSKIPGLDTVSDEEMPLLFENDDSRQLIHITYGLILTKKNPDGSFTFRDRLYRIWRQREDLYAQALDRHIGKHLELLGVKKG